MLLFVTDLELGGTPTVVRELAKRLPADVACLGRFGPTAEEIGRDGGRVEAFGLGVAGLPGAVRRLRRLARGHDVVLSFLVHANVVAALARRGGDGARWWQSAQTTQPRPRWHWHAQRFAARRAEGIIVPTADVADACVRRSGVPRVRLHVVPNGVDAGDLADAPRPARGPGSPLRVVFLGRLDPVKRVPMLIDAVRPLAGVTLDVFGDGPDRPRVRAAAAGAGNVRLRGWAARGEALRDADLLALPSEAEGFGLVLIEAMAAGVPVVGSDAPGIREVIDHGVTGLLADDLRAAIASVRDDPRAAATRAAAALAWVRRERTWESVVGRYREVLGA